MRPATPTVSRNQYAPFRGVDKLLNFQFCAMGLCRNSVLPPLSVTSTLRAVKLLRLMLVLAVACAMPACASWFKKKGPKSSATMYDGDESPHIRMYDDAEGPGSLLHN